MIQAYGEGRFRINATPYTGSVLIFAEATHAWLVSDASGITLQSLEPVSAEADTIDILIIGCGEVYLDPPRELRRALRDLGISLEWMDTGAACRTFNVLLTEDRQVAAALISVE